MEEIVILSRWVHFAALCFLAGGALFRLVVVPQSPARGREIAVATAAVLSALGWLAGVAAEMAGGWPELLAPDTLAAVLTETRFGQLWCVRLVLLAAMMGVACALRSRRMDILILGLSVATLGSLVGAGHGVSGSGTLGVVHATADVMHLLGASAWLGALAALARLLGEHSHAMIRHALPRFSRLGYGAVAVLLLTGCINTASLIAGPEQFFSSEYGLVLLVKLTLVAVMLAIAVANRLVLSPRALLGDDFRALRYSVAVEQFTGVAVLAVVALLGTIPPGR